MFKNKLKNKLKDIA